MFVDEYIAAKGSQRKKSEIVEKVLDIICQSNPPGAAFVKYQNGRYWTVDSCTAREKVGAMFRDCLADQYSSSSKSKIARRRQRRAAAHRMQEEASASTSSTGSHLSIVQAHSSESCSVISDEEHHFS